jgi:hypothetical protein
MRALRDVSRSNDESMFRNMDEKFDTKDRENILKTEGRVCEQSLRSFVRC